MKTKKLFLVFTVVLCIACLPFASFANGNFNSIQPREINFLEGGYTIYDEDGNVKYQSSDVSPNFVISDDGEYLDPGDEVIFWTQCWYNGGTMNFYCSETGTDVELLRVSSTSSMNNYKYLGYFTATKGDWYGKLTKKGYGIAGYFRYGIKNYSTDTVRIDSFTGIEN